MTSMVAYKAFPVDQARKPPSASQTHIHKTCFTSNVTTSAEPFRGLWASVPGLWSPHRHGIHRVLGFFRLPRNITFPLMRLLSLLYSLHPSLWDQKMHPLEGISGHQLWSGSSELEFMMSYLLIHWVYLWISPEERSPSAGSWAVHSSSAYTHHTMRSRACQHRPSNQVQMEATHSTEGNVQEETLWGLQEIIYDNHNQKKGRSDSTGRHHPSLQETEVGSLCVQGLPRLQGKFKGSLDTEVRACLKVKRSGQWTA